MGKFTDKLVGKKILVVGGTSGLVILTTILYHTFYPPPFLSLSNLPFTKN
jgi:hypothetical protein